MRSGLVRLGLMAALAAFLAGCSDSSDVVPPVIGTSDNATEVNPRSAFSLVVDAGLTPVTVSGVPAVNFAVIGSNGNHVPGLKLSGGDAACGGNNVAMGIASFDGSNWQSLISRTVPATGGGTVVEATTDPITGATLQENAPSGYYTYHFSTAVAAVMDNATVHRAGIRLCYVDPQTGATVKVNPYLDFTLDSSGIAHPIVDGEGKLADVRKVVDRASCNECHQTLAARHDDGFVDPNVCVICHNPGSTDYATGNPIDLKLMVHRIHMGKKLKKDYQLSTLVVRKDTGGVITGVNYPQEQKSCIKCHDSSKASDAENWKSKPGKNACWGCHSDYKDTTSRWYSIHFWTYLLDRDNPDVTSDSVCAGCHANNTPHTIPAHDAKHRYNIDTITWNPDRTVSVKFSVSNVDGTANFDIEDDPKLANLTMLVGWGNGDYSNAGARDAAGNLIPGGQPFSISAASAVPVGSNYFQLTSTPLPATASGTGVVALKGSIAYTGYSAPVKDAVSYFAIGDSGPAVPRRTVVSAEKCNTCHGRFLNMNNHVPSHAGNSTELETCVICHNGNSVLNGTTVAGGVVTVQPDSANFKRLIHMKHKAQGANYPVMPSALITSGPMAGSYTGIKNCDVCHVDGSYKNDLGVTGSSTLLEVDLGTNSTNATIIDTDPSNNPVISPRASACSSCHDDDATRNHMIVVGGAAFGTVTQGDIADGKVNELCYGCHAPGAFVGVDVRHGLK